MLGQLLPRFKSTRLALLADDISSPARAVFVGPAEGADDAWVNKLLTLTGGHLHVTLLPERVSGFMLQPMANVRRGMAISTPTFIHLESVEARHGVTTGISSSDRAQTIRTLADPHPHPKMIVKPGHVFPVAVREGGVLVKAALAEGASDIVHLAGFGSVAVLSEALSPSGEFLPESQFGEICAREGLPLIFLSQIIGHRLRHETLVQRVASAHLPTRTGGRLISHLYHSPLHAGDHVALVKGDISGDRPVLTRVHPEFTFADVFGGDNPPSRSRLQKAMSIVEAEGRGIIVYLRRTEPGALSGQVSSWSRQFQQKGAYAMREYGLGAQILRDLGVKQVELLTDSQKTIPGLNNFGLEISGYRPL